MTDEPRRRDLVDLTPYLLGAEVGEGEGATAVPELLEVTFVRREPAPLTGPGYLVLVHRETTAGDEVLVGSMPNGLAGGVTEWTPGRLFAEDTGD